MQDVRTNVNKLDNLVAKGAIGKAEFRAAKLVAQVKTLEEKALARVAKIEKKLEGAVKADLAKALKRYEKSWTNQRTKNIARQLKAVEKSVLTRVKTAEKRLHKQAAVVIKKAEAKVESLKGTGSKASAKRSPGRPKKQRQLSLLRKRHLQNVAQVAPKRLLQERRLLPKRPQPRRQLLKRQQQSVV